MPSRTLVDKKYNTNQMKPYHQWFYCNFIQLHKDKIKAWFYGHTHMPSRTILCEIPFICNILMKT